MSKKFHIARERILKAFVGNCSYLVSFTAFMPSLETAACERKPSEAETRAPSSDGVKQISL